MTRAEESDPAVLDAVGIVSQGVRVDSARSSLSCSANDLNKVYCRSLAEYPDWAGIRDPKKRKFSLCQSEWKKSGYKYADANLCGGSDDRYSGSFRGESRKEQEQKGEIDLLHPMKSIPREKVNQIKARLDRLIAEIKAKTVRNCCGEEKECRNAMERTSASWCSSKAKDSEVDPCAAAGKFSFSYSDTVEMWKRIQSQYDSPLKLSNWTNDARLKTIQEIVGSHLKKRDLSSRLRPYRSVYPRSGHIELSPYVNFRSYEESIQEFQDTVVHEFAHACDMVQMQLQAVRFGDNAEAALHAVEAAASISLTKFITCEATAGVKAYYGAQLRSLGSTVALNQCLLDITAGAKKKESPYFCSNVCPRSYLTETYAVADSFRQVFHPREQYPFPMACRRGRDGKHPAILDVMECFANFSEPFRMNFRKAYGCN